MTNIFYLAFKVSRVRFWLYLGGTYLLGYMVGITDLNQLLNINFVIHLFFFMVPANIFLYGVNDISDKDTDMFNPKKDEKEYRAAEKDRKNLYLLVAASFIYGILLILFLQPDLVASAMFFSWMLLSTFYSVKPLRFKARPVLDFTSNFLYVIPALLAFYHATLIVPPFLPIFAAFMWTSAMHLFSAIPDIEADMKADLKTTAVVVGKRVSLFLCFAFWATFAMILVLVAPWNAPWNLLMLVYPSIPLYLLVRPSASVEKAYWYFPYYTGLFGMVLFLSLGIPLLGVG
ncbi:MAG: prenyltransferase [Candidatus Thorarchaeota archaeon]|nr:MAG: prenyltransferase [Candidatus Thorarchaeota archaeon]